MISKIKTWQIKCLPILLIIVCFLLINLLLPINLVSAKTSSRNLTIFAEPNLFQALTKISRAYSKKNNVVVSINFNSSEKLIDYIEEGGVIDLFICANEEQIKAIKQRGLADVYNSVNIAFDKLVLVTSNQDSQLLLQLKNQMPIAQAIKILDKDKIHSIIDDEETLLDTQSLKLINETANLDLELSKKLDEEAKTLNNPDLASKYYAISLASQAQNKKDITIVTTFDKADIIYQALIIAGDNMEVAREFVQFLKSKEAKLILVESGFIVK
jgi:molybdenum ABC transporter molybdate-binding protein